MRLLTLKKVLICLLLGGLGAIVLAYLELRNISKYIETDFQLTQAIIFLFVHLAIIISGIIISIILIKDYLIQLKREHNALQKWELFGLVIVVISILTIVPVVYSYCPPTILLVLGVVCICIGIKGQGQEKSRITIAFILWGVTLLVLLSFSVIAPSILPVWIPM